jgi:antitoxin PrlF
MDVAAKLTSKGQITVPKAVRDGLELEPGDQVLFRLEGGRAVLARTQNFLDLAGSVPVPAGKRGASWEEIRGAAWRARGQRLKEQS